MILNKYPWFSGLSLMCGLIFTGCFPVERLYCNTAQWFVLENQQKRYFGRQLSRFCERYDNYDLDTCGDLEWKHRVSIKNPVQLDNYLSSTPHGRNEHKHIYIGNIYNSIVNNYDNDYMVAKGLSALAEVQEEPQPFYEYIIRLYLYDYFSENKPLKTKHFDETCNLIAEAVDHQCQLYLVQHKKQAAIDLLGFILKRKRQIDPYRIKKLSESLTALKQGQASN